MMLVVLFYAVFSIFFVDLYVKKILKEESIEVGESLVAIMSYHIADDLLIKDYVSIEKLFEETMKANKEVAYIFVEQNGRILLNTFSNGFPKELLNIGHKKNAIDYMLVKANNETYYDFSAPIFEGRAGMLRLGLTERMGEKMVKETIKSLIYIALITLIAAFAFSILLSKRLVHPLFLLTDSAVKIAGGDYSRQIEIHGEDEVGKLSAAFNKMEDAVKIREKELREINEEMETVNIKLHEYITELNRTKDELVKSKQDAAVVQTARSMIHHMRQPLTYLIMAIELFTEDIQGGAFNADLIQKRLFAIEEASLKVSDILKKFEQLREYRIVKYSDKTEIIDIGE